MPPHSPIRFVALASDLVQGWRDGAADANGQAPEHSRADGPGNPCRHCLGMIPEGAPMLVLAHRPFPAPQPYAEVGPIFLCGDACARADDAGEMPAILASPDYIVRGYGRDDRIVYGTGRVVPQAEIPAEAALTLADPRVAYVHVRSARNNCYQVRIDRA
jgi:hypothetical protein